MLEDITLLQLLEANLVAPGTVLASTDKHWGVSALLNEDETLSVYGARYSDPSGAAMAVTKHPVDGWDFWEADGLDGPVRLSTLRNRYRETHQSSPDVA